MSNLARLIVNIIMKVKLFTLALVTLTAGLLASCKKADLTTSVTGVTLDKKAVFKCFLKFIGIAVYLF